MFNPCFIRGKEVFVSAAGVHGLRSPLWRVPSAVSACSDATWRKELGCPAERFRFNVGIFHGGKWKGVETGKERANLRELRGCCRPDWKVRSRIFPVVQDGARIFRGLFSPQEVDSSQRRYALRRRPWVSGRRWPGNPNGISPVQTTADSATAVFHLRQNSLR